MYGFRSYISVPLRYPDGRWFGTLCAIDPNPASVNNAQVIGMFRLDDARVARAEKHAAAGQMWALSHHHFEQRLRFCARLAADDRVARTNYTLQLHHRGRL